jgi:hypothetical protein
MSYDYVILLLFTPRLYGNQLANSTRIKTQTPVKCSEQHGTEIKSTEINNRLSVMRCKTDLS